MIAYEYRAESIPFHPGPEGRTNAILNRFGAEGWDLVACELVTVGASLVGVGGQQTGGTGLVCVLKRPVGKAFAVNLPDVERTAKP